MTEEKNTQSTQWHPAFTGAMHMEFAENKDDLEFQSKLTLNTMPLRVDMLVIRKRTEVVLKNEIGRILVVEETVSGIYYICGYSELMIQIVVTKELSRCGK